MFLCSISFLRFINKDEWKMKVTGKEAVHEIRRFSINAASSFVDRQGRCRFLVIMRYKAKQWAMRGKWKAMMHLGPLCYIKFHFNNSQVWTKAQHINSTVTNTKARNAYQFNQMKPGKWAPTAPFVDFKGRSGDPHPLPNAISYRMNSARLPCPVVVLYLTGNNNIEQENNGSFEGFRKRSIRG